MGVVVLATNGFAEVCLYDKAEKNNRHVPALEKFANTLTLDAGAAFVPVPASPAPHLPPAPAHPRSASPSDSASSGSGA